MDRLANEQIEVYTSLMYVAAQLRFRLEEHLRDESSLTFAQFEILGRLLRSPDGRLRMTDLADDSALSRSGLTYQVSSLAEAELIVRSPSPDDERATLVELTERGRAEFLHALPGHVAIVRQLLFDALGPDEAEQLGAALGHVQERIRTLPPRSARPRGTTRRQP